MFIGDQGTADMVMVKRLTDALREEAGSTRIGSMGHAESDEALSAVMWDD